MLIQVSIFYCLIISLYFQQFFKTRLSIFQRSLSVLRTITILFKDLKKYFRAGLMLQQEYVWGRKYSCE